MFNSFTIQQLQKQYFFIYLFELSINYSMLRANLKIHKDDQYYQLKEIKDDSKDVELTKLILSIDTKIKSINSKKTEFFATSNPKDIIAKGFEFNNEYSQFTRLFRQLQEFNAVSSQEVTTIQKQTNKVQDFINKLDPNSVNQKLNSTKMQILEQSKNLNQSMPKGNNKSGTQISATLEVYDYKSELQKNRIQLLEIQKLMGIINNMAFSAKNLILEQGVQLEIGAQKISNAKNNIRAGKQQIMQARDYVQDHNKRTLYICLTVTLIISIILMVMYATNKKG